MTARAGAAGLLSLALFAIGIVTALASVDRGARVAGCLAMLAGFAGLVTVGLLLGSTPSGLVFTRENGTMLRPEYVTRHFQVLTERAGLPEIRLHDLRHTNASLALEAGVALKVVSERLGHSTTAITADIYTHGSSATERSAARQIAAVLGDSATDAEPEDRRSAHAAGRS